MGPYGGSVGVSVLEDWLVDLEVCLEDNLFNWKLETAWGMETISGLSVS